MAGTKRGRRQWRKSSLSGSGDCVEVAFLRPEDAVVVRDSKDPDGQELRFTVTEWKAFVAGVRDGEFDF